MNPETDGIDKFCDFQLGTSQSLSEVTLREIAYNFQSFKNFLVNTCWITEKDIPAIEYIINEKDSFIKDKMCNFMPELYVGLKKSNIDDDTIYSFIWPELVKNYARIVDNEGAVLSAYLIKSIIDRNDTHEISHVSNLLEKFDEKICLNWLNGLSIDEIKEILRILINYYNKYICEHDNDEDNWFKDWYKEDLKCSERELWSLEVINFENSKNQTDFLEQRISYYLQQYSEISSKDIESKDYLTKKIFWGNHKHHEMNWLINVNDVKFSRNLFFELLEYPEFYKKLMQNLDKFLLEHLDYRYFFDLIIKRKNVSELKTLESSIDDFKWLEDEDYIKLYLSLYPERKSETSDLESSQFILKCFSSQIESMKKIEIGNNSGKLLDYYTGEEEDFEERLKSKEIREFDRLKRELKDFIDLIKTTKYWTEDICRTCYEELARRNDWHFIIPNYAMWYFNQIMEDEILMDISEPNEKTHIIREYLPIFQLEKIREYDDKILAGWNISLTPIYNCLKLKENRETLYRGWRWKINIDL